jgi:protein-S-isoprenylcysteine O-methyltransferase Ste14
MDFPLFVVALTISTYWATVLLLVVYRRLLHGHSAGVLPRQRYERRLWRLIVPVVGAWIALPWVAVGTHLAGLALPAWAADLWPVFALRAAAAAAAVLGYLLSLACWLRMGRSWTMAVVPDQEARLVTAGLYRWVRHPIYSLSILLMLLTAAVLPTVPMAVLATLHVLVMTLKARHEEGYLLKRFGTDYARYCSEVGRFWPTWTPPARRAG